MRTRDWLRRASFPTLPLLVLAPSFGAQQMGARDPLPAAYTATRIGRLSNTDEMVVRGINGRGVVVGYCRKIVAPNHAGDILTYAFRWREGRTIALPTLGGEFSKAFAINEAGDIAGEADAHAETVPIVWPGGDVAAPLALSPVRGCAQAINRRGDVAGVEPGRERWRLVVWQQGRRREWLGPKGRVLRVTAMNDRGEVVGHTATVGTFSVEADKQPFVWRNGVVTMLPIPEGRNGEAAAIGDDGVIVGSTWNNRGIRPCAWEAGALRVLGSLGGSSGSAEAIGKNGVVVGTSETAAGEARACAWIDGQAVDLNDRVRNAVPTLELAKGINTAGQIIVETQRHDWFALTPVRDATH
jgi:probable HAF family extracellular repeat protein